MHANELCIVEMRWWIIYSYVYFLHFSSSPYSSSPNIHVHPNIFIEVACTAIHTRFILCSHMEITFARLCFYDRRTKASVFTNYTWIACDMYIVHTHTQNAVPKRNCNLVKRFCNGHGHITCSQPHTHTHTNYLWWSHNIRRRSNFISLAIFLRSSKGQWKWWKKELNRGKKTTRISKADWCMHLRNHFPVFFKNLWFALNIV